MAKRIEELSSSNKKQCLYMIELLINQLNLNSKNIINEINNKNSYLKINLKFLNLPTFVIKEHNKNSIKNPKNKLRIVDFSACGISCLFTKCPNNFSDMMKQKDSLKIEIYKLNRNAICPEIDDEFDNDPICQTTIHLDGCFCDQFDMAMNDGNNLPESFEVKKSYELLDTVKKPCGTIDLFTRISCCGTSIITQFHHDKKSFIFKNYNSPNEFECLRVLSPREKHQDINNDVAKAKTIVGITKLCQDLPNKLSHTDVSMKINGKRMRGGGLDDKNINLPLFPIQSMQTLLSGACRTNNHDYDKPGCGCHGKSGLGLMKMAHGCSNKPCHGIDCLIRAFKDTQEFVDNIKVTGMPGLGLMDPTESPYFSRNRYRDLPTTCSDRNKFDENNLLNNPKDINIILDNSNRHNATALMGKKPKPDEQSLQNDEFIQHQDKNSDNDMFAKDLSLMKKKTDKNNLNDNNELSVITNEPTGQLNTIIENEIIDKTRNIRKKKRKKKYLSKPQQTFLLNSKVKPSIRIMKLVRAAASRLHFGHKSCVDIRMRVPGNMGWLWNTKNTAGEPKAQIGWKPGAISRRVWRLLEDAKVEKIDDTPVERPVTPTKGKKSKTSRKRSSFLLPRSQGTRRKEYDDEIDLPPTLHIHRKDGTYYITLFPINKDHINNPELQESVAPLQFKVTKDKEDADSSSVASDIEFEFSPPVADTHYRQTKVQTKTVNTQVQQQEIINAINDSTQLMKTKRKLTRAIRKIC